MAMTTYTRCRLYVTGFAICPWLMPLPPGPECLSHSLPLPVLCRNVSSGVEHFHQHFRQLTGLAPFSPAISREDRFAYKPSPEVSLLCRAWVKLCLIFGCGAAATDGQGSGQIHRSTRPHMSEPTSMSRLLLECGAISTGAGSSEFIQGCCCLWLSAGYSFDQTCTW
jgi:hypothetical protein